MYNPAKSRKILNLNKSLHPCILASLWNVRSCLLSLPGCRSAGQGTQCHGLTAQSDVGSKLYIQEEYSKEKRKLRDGCAYKRVDPSEKFLKDEEPLREILLQGSGDERKRRVVVTQVRLGVHKDACKGVQLSAQGLDTKRAWSRVWVQPRTT
jgi:hypothetical protein